ncbi:MAG: HAD family hydrolase [Planctomycetota bacterium]
MAIRFIYFDLGRVLLDFDVPMMIDRVSVATGLVADDVHRAIFVGGLQVKFETGLLTLDTFHEEFCRTTGAVCELTELMVAAADIFEPRPSMLPVVSQLYQAGYPLGVLSNTADHHWQHCLARYALLREFFQVYALSFRIGAMKPARKIYEEAARLAGYPPGEIFFCDDILENVEGARAAGLDAVQYTSTPQLVEDLRKRGVRFNY